MLDTDLAQVEVLIVDDDAYQRKILVKMLSLIGVQKIHQAASAEIALEIIHTKQPSIDFIISDLDMPDIDGMEFLRLLAEQNIRASVLVISATHNNILRSVNVMAAEYGLAIVGALPKPYKLPVLREILERHLLEHSYTEESGPVKVIRAYEIRQALELGQFLPFFQPKLNLETRKVLGVEALVRWKRSNSEIVSPGGFIDLVEEYGLMDQLTWTMLEQSLFQLRQWKNKGIDISISINISQSCLSDTKLPKRIFELLERYRLDPELLIVEITESLAMTDLAHCLETLSRLRMKGVGLSIDDFGTGHSSLQQLSRAPYTELKIDQVFVSGSHSQPHLQAVLESSVGIANKFSMSCVGEGIETLEDLQCLQSYGCHIGQGFYFARPMNSRDFEEWYIVQPQAANQAPA